MVNFEELPIPPGEILYRYVLVTSKLHLAETVISNRLYLSGFPPIPGHKSTGAEQGFVAALVAADKLTAADEPTDEEEVCMTVGRPSHLDQLDVISSVFISSLRLQFQKSQCSPR